MRNGDKAKAGPPWPMTMVKIDIAKREAAYEAR
jgi:hypothetical protein